MTVNPIVNKIQDWLVIVNPNAGRRKGEKDWPEISGMLKEAGFNFSSIFTEHRNHALNIALEHFNAGYRKVIVVGGDGTLNEVVNAVFAQKNVPTTSILIGMIMVGTGNDWGRMYNIKTDYKQAIKIIKRGRSFIQDAAMVNFHEGEEEKSRYYVNMAGMGYDALVADMTNKMKEQGKGGPMAYFYNIFRGLFKYDYKHLEVTVDGKEVFSGRVFSLSIGVCKFNGGGMMQLPNAIPDDGLLDLTIIKKTSKLNVVKHIKKLYDGSFLNLPFIQTHTGKTFSIVSKPVDSIYLETDGESLGHSPLHFQIIPKSVKVITGKNWSE